MRKDIYTCDLCKKEIGEEIKTPHAYIDNAFYNISSHGKSVDLCVDCIKEFNEFLTKRMNKLQSGSYTDGQGNTHTFLVEEWEGLNNKIYNLPIDSGKIPTLKGYGTCYNVMCRHREKDNICNKTDLIYSECNKQIKTRKEDNENEIYCYNNECMQMDSNNRCGLVDCKNRDKMSKVTDEECKIDDYEKEENEDEC